MPTCTINPMASPHKYRLFREACFDDSTDVLTSNTDDFIIGDRVFVNGTKPGYIQYIGETQFAPGEWAGVVLDDAVGKNDGSVSGVRYFQCEPKRGVFARLHRITRLPCSNGLSPSVTQYPDRTVVTTTRLSSTPTSPASSIKSGRSPSLPGQMMMATTTMTTLSGGLRVGDRVLVNATSGVKMGWLRYLGPAEFATGNWAGVELDEPIGKNDGSVAGKRYFECRTKFGLFAPLHKVSKVPSGRNSVTTTTSRVMTPVQGLQRRSGSHESLNSSLSSASSLARAGRVRLGVKALATNTQKPSRPSTTSTSAAAHSALQNALKEKEEHIEQLLKERDLERSEVARAAAQVEETEHRLANVHADRAKLCEEMNTTQAIMKDQMESLELERTELSLLLEDERKKVEDLQFRLEEESITRSELENQSQEEKKRAAELEKELEQERLKTSILSQDSDKVSEAQTLLNTYKDNAEALSKKVTALEEMVKVMETKESENEAKLQSTHSELVRKEESILQLETSLDTRKKELSSLQQRLAEMEEELKSSKEKQEKQLEVIDGLNLRVTKSESCSSGLNEELQTVKVSSADLDRQLKTAETRCEQLSQQKTKLEQQIAELIRTSGDNSEHVTQMNNDLRQKEKLVDELQGKVNSATQELEKHKDLLKQAQTNATTQVTKLAEEHQAHNLEMQKSIDEKTKELEKLKQQLDSVQAGREDQESSLKAKCAEMEDLQRRLHKEEAEGTMLRASLQETQLKLEGLSHNVTQTSKQAEDERRQLIVQNELLQKERDQVLHQQSSLEESLNALKQECDSLRQQKAFQEEAIKEREGQVAALQEETKRLRTDFAQHKEDLLKKLAETQMDSQAIEEMQQQMELQQDTIKSFQSLAQELENQKSEARQEMEEIRKNFESQIQSERSASENQKKKSEEIIERYKGSFSELEKDKAAIIKDVEELRIKSQEDARNIKQLEQKISELSTANSHETSGRQEELSRVKSQCQRLEDDKRQLENKVVQLQVTLAKSNNENESDQEIRKLREEKETLDAQIEFLNSVIVDMQRKNDELNTKMTNAQSETDLLAATDLNLNGIRTVRPPRLFCDICDCFDLHDTEDCPTQCTEVEERSSHSHHGGKRNEERPYCDSCEVFGHWTKDCDDGETF